MNEFEEYIETLLADKESDDLEFKTAKGGLPGSLWETYSAFANTDGGTIVLGVKELNGEFVLDGLDVATVEKYKKDFWNKVNNHDVVNTNLLKNDDVVVCEYEGRMFLSIYVPRANREQRPVYHGRSPYGGTYKRNNEGDYKCTDNEVRRMFADADLTIAPDMRVLTGFTWDDIDMESLKQYRQLMAISKPGHPWLALDDLQLMTQLGGYRKDRRRQQEGFTLAGMLMFGKTTSITDPECCPHYMVDYREIPEDTTMVRWVDRVWPDGTWEANLFQFYRRVLPKLQNFIPQQFRLEDDTRIDSNSANEAMREAFVNTCVHASYSTEYALVILKKKHEIVFSNPGTLLVSKKQYYAGGDSVCRNPMLQKMFSMLGHAEKAGSGVAKIMQGWNDINWRRPFVEETRQPDKVVLTMPLESLMSDLSKEKLSNAFGEERLSALNHNELLTLAATVESGEITNESLRGLVDLHRVDITSMLKKLCQLQFLTSLGTRRGTRYRLAVISNATPQLDIFSCMANDAPMVGQDKVAASANNIETSANNIETSANNIETSANNIETSANNIETSRMKKDILYNEIRVYCGTWRSLPDVATHVGRTQSYLRNFVIKKMVEEGILIPQYPEQKNHPNQKYRAK